MTPASIRALIAASDGSDQGEILQAAWSILIGPKPERVHGGSDELTKWLNAYNPFYGMIRARAHTEAALLIAEAVLPGWEVSSSATYAEVRENPPPATYDEQPYELTGLTSGTGTTRALAIIDAVCAAVERKDETNG